VITDVHHYCGGGAVYGGTRLDLITTTQVQTQSPKYDTSFRLLDFNIFDEKREKEEEEDDGGAENDEESSHRRNNDDAGGDNGQKKYKKDGLPAARQFNGSDQMAWIPIEVK
jgi:hypothetical protein